MTPQQRQEVARYLKAFDFSGLFTDPSVGWDWPDSGGRLRVPFQDEFIELETIAEKRGVKVLLVPPLSDGTIMPSDQRKKLEKAVTPLAAEHLLIFADHAKTRQVWLWTSRLPGKPVRHRELTWEKGRANELLLQKLTTIAFTLDEEEALDVTGVVQRLRDNLDRDKLTKKFYNEFKSQKDRFQTFISGLMDKGILAHYTSLMLNRLMFCYFLQQKGFLNGEQDYLGKRLQTVRDTLGQDQFHSFYRSFLKRLFHEGFDGEERPPELTALIGQNIPYLNGGIFAEHPIERAHPEIQIPDDAFEKIFKFFDEWNWHLDDRPLAQGNEINPEVLGYVFEKYTNQKEMGAYYTKEDITEYISKNTILPFLLQKVGDKLSTDVWELLENDPDRYIYEPVRRGVPPLRQPDGSMIEPDEAERRWLATLAEYENIAIGLDTEAPDLLERRKNWNKPAAETHKLPTEIWRETIARHQRCHELRRKLRAGEVRDPAELVTLNLNICQFMQDVIDAAPADLVLALWKTLRSLSVLDPTCGSGAFLFAALEILQPLYDGLLERFETLRSDWKTAGEEHPVWEKEMAKIIDAVERHPNEGYFIHKTIIVHNLYGVDIMEEAVEICKLRLFLKLAAQLEPGQAIEPLPDIDFNIRAGNTLVGYASRDEIKRAFTEAGGSGQMALQGIETSLDDFRRVMEQAEDADRAFRRFQDLQDTIGQDAASFRAAKQQLEGILHALRAQLDRFLAGQYDQRHLASDMAFRKWKNSHEPFHWFVEFYGIMNGGGFDVIVGNPPYVELARVKGYAIQNFQTTVCGNLYCPMLERFACLGSEELRLGAIVPLSLSCTDRMSELRKVIGARLGQTWISHYSGDANPSKLFEGAKLRLDILLSAGGKQFSLWSTQYLKWFADARATLFSGIAYTRIDEKLCYLGLFPKLGSKLAVGAMEKLLRDPALGRFIVPTGRTVFVHRVVTMFVKCFDFVPYFRNETHGVKKSEDYKPYQFFPASNAEPALAALNSSTFFHYFVSLGDCFHCGKEFVYQFPFDVARAREMNSDVFSSIVRRLMEDLKNNAIRRRAVSQKTGAVEYDEFWPSRSKRILDEIDAALAEHYGFTEEELDFIINYDIKYRMGLGGAVAEEEAEQ